MNLWRVLAVVGLAAAAQAFLGRLAPSVGSRIDLLLVAVAAVARRGSPVAALGSGAVAGGIEDALSGALFGLNGFAKTLLGYLLSLVSGRVLVDHPGTVALALAGSSIANAAIVGILRFLLAQKGAGPSAEIILSRALLTALAGLAIASLARQPWRERWREARLRRQRRRT